MAKHSLESTVPALEEDDPEIALVREARKKLSAQFEHDPHRLVAFFLERQKGHEERLFRAQESPR